MNKNELKKLWTLIRLKQEQSQLKYQERLKIKDWDKLIDKATKRFFVLWILVLLTIWTYYKLWGII